MKRAALLATLMLGCCLFPTSVVEAARFALVVGNDEGRASDVRLRYAESDAAQLADLLRRLGAFAPEDVVIATGRDAQNLRRALNEMTTRLRALPGEHVALVFYSGHADAQSLHLGSSSFPVTELRAAVASLPATVRVLILDACQSGVLTRAKGGAAGPAFTSSLQEVDRTRGLAILAASSASELAQESDELGGAIFTHYLGAGLSGLADRDGDGEISLGEAFAYASQRTLSATLGTTTGPQHPSFHFDLEVTNDLKLTRPGARGVGYGHLQLDSPGWYFVKRPDGTIAAEIVSHGHEQLALLSGPYEITRRNGHNLEVASLLMGEGDSTPISSTSMRRVSMGRLVRKGGGPAVSYGLSAATMGRTPLTDLGASFGMALAARADLNALSWELRLGVGRAQSEEPHLSVTTWETTLSVAALRMRDFGSSARRLALAAGWGLVVGAASMVQKLDSGETHRGYSPFAGPTGVAELSVGYRAFVRGELGVPVYALRVANDGERKGATTLWRPAVTVALGAGLWF